jgi:hypothetical protein
MFLRVVIFIMLLFFCTSCDRFSFEKNKNAQVLDTIVDFSSIDVSPSFKVCDSIIDKNKKTTCFRTTIHQKITEGLKEVSFEVKKPIDETIDVLLSITSKGKITIASMAIPKKLKKELPELDSLFRLSVHNLPIIYPAIKRGIPVNTQYQLPIRLLLKE